MLAGAEEVICILGWSKEDRMARTYFPLTTPSQRRLLFETWQATGAVEQACRVAHVGRRTFYYWKARFLAEGYPGLERFASRAPHRPHQTAPAVVAQVLVLRQQQPAWGKQRLADELAKANAWVPLVSPNTIKRILRDAGLWPEPGLPEKKGGRAARTGPPTSPAKPST
jgi:transposase